MGISTKRIILTIILAVLLVIAFGWVIMMQNHAALVRNNAGDETLKREEVAQTLDDIEYIFVNDATLDKSISILKRIIEKYGSFF